MHPPGWRRRAGGFSLIELLIVVAIIAALVGVATPFFQNYLRETRAAKARQDLEVLKGAVLRLQQKQRHPVGGDSLRVLEGRTLQELPRDPWGNDYFFDGNLAVIGSFGADGIQGGQGEEEDIVVQYQTYVVIQRAAFSKGGTGIQKQGNRLELNLSKPVAVVPGYEILLSTEVVVIPPYPAAYPVPLQALGFQYRPEYSEPELGLITFEHDGIATGLIPMIHKGSKVTFGYVCASLVEDPDTHAGLVDRRPYLWGPEPTVGSDGKWTGARLGD